MSIQKFTAQFTEEQVIEIVARLGDAQIQEGSHGFENYKGMKIVEAAKKQAEKFGCKINAAISVIGVVLGANRNWEKAVQPKLNNLKINHSELTFKKLQNMLSEMNWEEFNKIWGHKDEKKYNVLSNLVGQILDYADKYPTLNDLQLMRQWVKEFDLEMLRSEHPEYAKFPGCIPNVGIATFQHLRLTFGVDTVKPDQRVKEVLREEFKVKMSSKNTILAVEEIADITKQSVIMIDQIFVKYGSGYYNKTQ